MPTPDPRPAGETALDRAAYLLTAERLSGSYQPDGMGWWMARVAETRTELAAEARAALLAGAPAVWVARDDDGIGWVFDTPPQKDRDGDWDVPDVHDKQWALNGMMNMPPGACVRYRLVPDPEGTP